MITRFALIVLFLIPNVSFSQEKATIARDLTVKKFQKQMTATPGLLLDVRTPAEVKKGAIPNSTNIDFFEENFEQKIDQIDKTKPVYVYCASGGRSGETMEMMKKKGFKEVYNLAGGYSAWQKANQK